MSVNEALRGLPRPHRPLPATVVSEFTDAVATRDVLQQALKVLPRRQLEVVVLRHLVGLSEVEVARALEISHGTVKTHLRRALTVLRERLGDLKEWHLATSL